MVEAEHMIEAVVCTGNAHKIDELAALLPSCRLRGLPADAPSPAETGTTFLANARIKAVAGAQLLPQTWMIADDSGLIVAALDGAPGVFSARFAGEDASDADNVRLLLQRLEHISDPELRRARFACVLVAIDPDGHELHAEGFVEGHIAPAPEGTGGFGYDPVFIPDGHTATFAQLGAATKADISHRARAAQRLDELIRAGG